MTGVSLVYVTAIDPKEARQIVNALLGERLIACANILPGMESAYWWEGKIEQAHECVVILKTRTDQVAAVSARVKELHSYACPCVLELPVASGNPDYLEWLKTAPDTQKENT